MARFPPIAFAASCIRWWSVGLISAKMLRTVPYARVPLRKGGVGHAESFLGDAGVRERRPRHHPPPRSRQLSGTEHHGQSAKLTPSVRRYIPRQLPSGTCSSSPRESLLGLAWKQGGGGVQRFMRKGKGLCAESTPQACSGGCRSGRGARCQLCG